MRKMKDSGVPWIGEIPECWDVVPIFNLFREHKIKNYGMQENNVLSLSYGNIIQRDVTSNMGLLPESFETYNIVEKGNIVLRLTDLQNDKHSLRTGLVKEKGIITSAYVTIELTRNGDSRFFHYLLHSYDVMKIIYNLGSGVRQNLKFSELSKLPLLCPPLSEQNSIANHIDKKCSKIDSTISNIRTLIDMLKEYKQSVITQAVTKGLNPDVPMKDSGFSWMGLIPQHWNSKGNVLNCIRFEGGSQPALQYFTHEPAEGYIRLIQNRDYKTDDYITYVPKNMVSKFCNKDDVMIGRYGPPLFVLHRGLEGAYNVAIMKALPIMINKNFMWFFLQNTTLIKYIEAFSIRSAGQSGVNPIILKNYPIFLPNNIEQQRIADYLDEKCAQIDSQIAAQESLLTKLEAYKKSLIYECVTGKREVPVLSRTSPDLH